MKDDARLTSVIDAPGLRAHLVPVNVTIERGGAVVHLAGQRFVMLTILSVDRHDRARALVTFSLN